MHGLVDLMCSPRTRPVCICLLTLVSLVSLVATPAAFAQVASKQAPNQAYYLAKETYNLGRYTDALRGFRQAARDGVVGIDGRWIDAICYHTMAGECLFELGQVGDALEQYEAALNLYVRFKDWMLRVKFPETILPADASTRRAKIKWGRSSRTVGLANISKGIQVLTGRLDNDLVVQRGGVVSRPELRLVAVHEIVHCIGVALVRRREIMGPACKLDPFTQELVNAAERKSTLPNHWSQVWAEAILGFAYVAADRHPEAVTAFQRSLVIDGELDHPVTGAALKELGRIAFMQGKYDAAMGYLHEATLSAAQFRQFVVMEEAFRIGAITHMVSGRKGIYPPLAAATDWARGKSRPLETSLFLLAAECSAEQSLTPAAVRFLAEAEGAMARSQILGSRIGARYHYQAAHVSFQQGNLTKGQAALADMKAFQQDGSLRLFQIALANRLYADGEVSPRVCADLFEKTLHEPNDEDWTLDPMETLTVVMTPRELPLQNWFEVVLRERKDQAKALEIADAIRRARFHSTLPLGGRLNALRWILEAPKSSLSDRALLQRQSLLVKFPDYAKLSATAKTVRENLSKFPLVPDTVEEKKEQATLLDELAKLSVAQEIMLNDIALRRLPSEFVFPPLRETKDVQAAMHEGQLTLAYLNTARAVYAFIVSKKELSVFTLSDPGQVARTLAKMLQNMGHFDRNAALSHDQLANDDWKTQAMELRKMLVDLKPNHWEFDELVVVPDSVLWYVPFEALQVAGKQGPTPIMSRIRMRYAPTFALTVPSGQGRRRNATMGVVAGKLFPRDEDDVADAAFAEIKSVDSRAARLQSPIPAVSSLFASLCNRMVVLDEIDDKVRGTFAWSPMQIDRGKPGSDLASWFALPWQAPEQMILPGFQTAAATGLRQGGTGDEIFLTVCGLMATGSRTVLLSRWRTGGQTCVDLMREFVRTLPRKSASKAWQRSVRLSLITEMDPDLEPRFNSSGSDARLTAEHPFFWSGYMLVDTGAEPKLDDL